MTERVAKFINIHEELIDANQFLKLYILAASHFNFIGDISEMTLAFKSVGIEPEKYMTLLPRFYLGYADIEEYSVLDGIKIIYDDAFKGCEKLKNLALPKSITMIGHAFEDCSNLKYIQYEGTSEEWYKIKKPGLAVPSLEKLQILCKGDGITVQNQA